MYLCYNQLNNEKKRARRLNINVTNKKIEDMCGMVSYKKGDSFYHANKVTLKSYTRKRCEAIVAGTENFYVTVEQADHQTLKAMCSCPSLASYTKDCQHVAAVLLAIQQEQRKGTVPGQLVESRMDQGLADDLVKIFEGKSIRSSVHQRHFENREVLALHFTCKLLESNGDWQLFGMEVRIGSKLVHDIRAFLQQMREGKPFVLSPIFTFDPEMHCFMPDTDAVLQELYQVIRDEKAELEEDQPIGKEVLLLPPSSWERVVTLLQGVPNVTLNYDGKSFKGIQLSKAMLPLQFDFAPATQWDYTLTVKGMEYLTLLHAYRSVLVSGKMIQLGREAYQSLANLKRMLDAAGTNQIPIPEHQAGFIIEKVAPGLKKIGTVHLSGDITNHLVKTPLTAKLYLDRLKNRLLASLEFEYEHHVINPLDQDALRNSSFIVRDVEKENEILELIDAGQFATTDGGYFLHNEDLEYEFLHYILPKLQKLVKVYATTAIRLRVMKAPVPPRIKVKAKKDRVNWLEFKFEMEGFPEKDIRAILVALEEKRKYYRLRDGALLSLETREFEEIQRFLQAAPMQQEDDLERGIQVPVIQGLRLLDATSDAVFSLEESFREFLRQIGNPELDKFQVPENVRHVLRDYQRLGFQWMKTLASFGFGGILADDMGLGKTLQSITFIQSELAVIRKRKVPVLIVCPASLTYNWLNELEKFTPNIQATILDGAKKERQKIKKWVMGCDVVIASYPLLRSEIQWFEKQAFHTVFFDEAQAFKNPMTQTARAVKKLQADYRFALTGTPIENALEELWSIFHVVFPELFRGLKEYSNLNRKQIARRIRPFLLRRVKEDVLSELPAKVEWLETVELLPEQKKLYGAYLAKLRHETLKHLDKDTIRKNRIRILAGLTRLRQICCHPALFVEGYEGKSAKFEKLKQLLEESRLAGRRVLIFSQFTKMLELIGRELTEQRVDYFYLDGQTPSAERVKRVERFNQGERNLFLISLKAGGTGLNLTGADTVILYDLWWNPAVEEQAADRAHRIGQEHEVQVIKIVARGTIEEKMNELQEQKKHLIEEMIDPQNRAVISLTEEDIREILMLQEGE